MVRYSLARAALVSIAARALESVGSVVLAGCGTNFTPFRCLPRSILRPPFLKLIFLVAALAFSNNERLLIELFLELLVLFSAENLSDLEGRYTSSAGSRRALDCSIFFNKGGFEVFDGTGQADCVQAFVQVSELLHLLGSHWVVTAWEHALDMVGLVRLGIGKQVVEVFLQVYGLLYFGCLDWHLYFMRHVVVLI